MSGNLQICKHESEKEQERIDTLVAGDIWVHRQPGTGRNDHKYCPLFHFLPFSWFCLTENILLCYQRVIFPCTLAISSRNVSEGSLRSSLVSNLQKLSSCPSGSVVNALVSCQRDPGSIPSVGT